MASSREAVLRVMHAISGVRCVTVVMHTNISVYS